MKLRLIANDAEHDFDDFTPKLVSDMMKIIGYPNDPQYERIRRMKDYINSLKISDSVKLLHINRLDRFRERHPDYRFVIG